MQTSITEELTGQIFQCKTCTGISVELEETEAQTTHWEVEKELCKMFEEFIPQETKEVEVLTEQFHFVGEVIQTECGECV